VPPTRDQILSANDATYEAWNAHDPDAVAAVFAEDAELRDAGNPEPVLGRDAIGGPRRRPAGRAALQRGPLPGHGQARRVPLGVESTGRLIRVEGATFSRSATTGWLSATSISGTCQG
jgi:SnoaL-like domain